MKKAPVIIGTVAGILLIGTAAILFTISSHGPSYEDVRHLTAPRIVDKDPMKMLVVEMTGDPNSTVGPAFGALFKTYFKIKGRPKGKAMEAPRARWPKPFETPRAQWVGIYALPVPASLQAVPDASTKSGLKVELREWHYGTVAEILHVGPYSSEDTTVQKLKGYITGSGYEICGDHEEEYLKGPGLLPTSPAKYLTVIRYAVRKAALPPTSNLKGSPR